jgi:hypothetical protein
MNRCLLALGTFAGGITAAACVGMSAAHADQIVVTLDPTAEDFLTQQSTTPFSDVLSGGTYLNVTDTTLSETGIDLVHGDGNLVLNPFTFAEEGYNLNIDQAVGGFETVIPVGTQVDVMFLATGYTNEFFDFPGVDGALNTLTDTLITPFGDYTLFSF